MQHGSLVNAVMGSWPGTPAVGMGATLLLWSDRHAATVVRVVSAKTIHVQQDHAKRVDTNGMSEMQRYEFTPNPDAPVLVARLTKRGWMSGGTRIALGHRSEYYDFSF